MKVGDRIIVNDGSEIQGRTGMVGYICPDNVALIQLDSIWPVDVDKLLPDPEYREFKPIKNRWDTLKGSLLFLKK